MVQIPEAATRKRISSVKKGFLRNFTNLTGEHFCQSLFCNKIAGLRLGTLFKKRLWHRCFPVNSAKFSGIPFLKNKSGDWFRICKYLTIIN